MSESARGRIARMGKRSRAWAIALITAAVAALMVSGVSGAWAQTGSHYLMVKAPASARTLTVVDGTLNNGEQLSFACFDLNASDDGWVGTGLRFQNETKLSISLSAGDCQNPQPLVADWSGSVPGEDGLDDFWVTPTQVD